MAAPTATELLEAQYSLTAASFGLTADAYAERVQLWEQVASSLYGTPAQQAARISVYALTAVIQHLIGQKDKVRVEGDITMERNILGRIEVLQGFLKAAQQAADGLTPGGTAPSVNPAPEFGTWNLV